MEVLQVQDWWKYTAAAGGAITSYWFGGWSAMLQLLMVLAFVDYGSGMTAAFVEGKNGTGPGLSSDVGARGIAKKVFMFVVVGLAHQVDSAMGEGHMIRDAAL
jgi:toxin secretion/phage lysis holin